MAGYGLGRLTLREGDLLDPAFVAEVGRAGASETRVEKEKWNCRLWCFGWG